MRRDELIRSVGRLEQVASVQRSVLTDGTASGDRVIDVQMWDGVSVQLLPDRGFDIGAAWFRGVPVAWSSRLGSRTALSAPHAGTEWITAFSGGLVTTCGLFNVGAPSEGAGMHGDYTFQRADEISIDRNIDETGQVTVTANATVREGSALGPLYELRRQWTFRTGAGTIELEDRVTNLGPVTGPAPILYHVNFGAPFWRQGATLRAPAGTVVPRDADAQVGLASYDRAPELKPHAPEWAFEHLLAPPADGEWPSFTISSPRVDVTCRVSWDPGTLPRVHQWVHPAETINALGIEPCNCTVLGRGVDREAGRMPVLEPDESRTTRLALLFSGRERDNPAP